jgi:hypothetical protein
MSETVQQLMSDALTLADMNPANSVPGSDISLYAVRVANRMLDSWSAQKLAIAGLKYAATYALTGAASYTIGPTATFNTTRPMKIKSASVIDVSGAKKDARVVPAEAFDKITDLTRTGLYIEDLTYDAGFPIATIRVTPMPAAGTLALWTYEQFTDFVNLTDTLALPPGFEEPLAFCLSERLMISFGKTPRPDLIAVARESKMAIASLMADILGQAIPTQPAQEQMAPQAGQ